MTVRFGATQTGGWHVTARAMGRRPWSAPAPLWNNHREAFLAISVLLVMIGYSVAPRTAPLRPGLRLGPVETAADSDGRNVEVAVKVLNPNPQARIGRVWWIIATPGVGGEWERRAYRSSVRTVDLEPGKEMSIRWREHLMVPTGRYVVSAWVHALGPEGFKHADGRIGASLEVGPGTDSVRRAGPPTLGVHVSTVAAEVDLSDPAHVLARTEIANTSGTERRVLVRMGLASVAHRDDPYWWRVPPAWAGEAMPLNLPSRGSTSVALDGRIMDLPSGEYAVRVTVADAMADPDGPIDEVSVVEPVVTVPAT